MSQFQNEAFQFDFVKCLVQTLRQSVAMATDLSFHFSMQIVTYSRKFCFVKINFNKRTAVGIIVCNVKNI